jgi:hypothetical protein
MSLKFTTPEHSIMPYYVFSISTPDGIGIYKSLKLMDKFENFKVAKKKVKTLRLEQLSDEGQSFKVMFAESQLLAEEQLLEKREKPVLMEHER